MVRLGAAAGRDPRDGDDEEPQPLIHRRPGRAADVRSRVQPAARVQDQLVPRLRRVLCHGGASRERGWGDSQHHRARWDGAGAYGDGPESDRNRADGPPTRAGSLWRVTVVPSTSATQVELKLSSIIAVLAEG